MKQIKSVNDFVIKFANVNGTGSASANNLFAKALFRMGLPVSPKNIFPSNIQGLPTWYEVRVSEAGYLGRRGGIDIALSVNPQSMAQDIKEVRSGGYFIYDNTKPLDLRLVRDDVNIIGIPLTRICNDEYKDPRQRQLFKNVIYVGALAALLNMDFKVLTDLVGDQFKGKEKLILPNIHALELGHQYARSQFECPIGIQVKTLDSLGDQILVDGNTALGLGAVYGGATVAAWYPITPSTSVVDAYEKYARRVRIDAGTGHKNYAIVQAEDELSAIGMVIGASWNGARAFTATSGPGVSLMSEFLGLAYFAEIPTVLFNVQRAGPSTGMPTRTQQSDILSTAYASHGDTKQVLLFPSTPRECFDFGALSFDLAERLQTPIIVMTDLDLGMNDNMSEPLAWDDARRYDRGKVMTAEQLEEGVEFGRYLDVDGDAISYRTYPGTHPNRGAFFTRGTSRDEYAVYTEKGEEYEKNMLRLMRKWDTIKEYVPEPEVVAASEETDVAVLYFGTSEASSREALDYLAQDDGIHLDAMRVRSFPFNDEVKAFIEGHSQVFVIEQNRDAQLRTLLMAEFEFGPDKLKSVLCFDGTPISARNIRKQIKQYLDGGMVMPLHRTKIASSAGE
ncbi:MAG: 2-oxoacid:acceptor oxidoreductase subunit alpha [Halioglobus sp.]|jgi:2-oxoglutarate ferredoxin oxidoreductase subunit alpha|uniref:2-oxoacid:acceptor oxidoreductase subunit alpha n=1 Tax=Candidatus Seongchinamella marina TaxID=2518990 RepID=A0ABT3STL2_9GAMM|nr:2-oxoacid:acceptor oxidoreductase subunit alpha [Candidatus Seongchinamella marina]MBT6123737.1 2-oxoacid:acceptor oxidoreductase subunit alpha [Halieaceae bacterium]MCX2973328.1 2-oxoacid:acceptor oxidoreductase subunit alpha [Candidatus Seongchinamella marina]MDG1390233.1 2-oxoacid:acceptor oxidoreductase subunit alpha [Halioglobus sp.]